ncbi:MAG: hypothetical protein JNK85_04080 [Verrucomicrobiales bacterium]|nr:hypothetical protein [Verrucomicrobiales bacterium]
MKLLRHPMVAVALAVIALGFVIYTIFQPRSRRYSQQNTAPAAPPAPEIADTPAPPAPSTTHPLMAAAPLPVVPMDVAAILEQLPRWIEAPGRDPFQPRAPGSFKSNGPKASDLLNLTAVWRQTGGRLAVINNTIVTEGDQVAGFRVDRIEADRIWVKGTNGTEHIDFKVPKGIEAQQPASPKAPPSAKG